VTPVRAAIAVSQSNRSILSREETLTLAGHAHTNTHGVETHCVHALVVKPEQLEVASAISDGDVVLCSHFYR